jgi:di/tricarboxylate transporter
MKSSRVGLRECWIAAALALYLLARFLPSADGLGPQGEAVLGTMAAGAILWMSEATPIGLTAIVVLVLLALSPGGRMSDVTGGFASEVVFFLIGTVAIGTAVEVSGLAAKNTPCNFHNRLRVR